MAKDESRPLRFPEESIASDSSLLFEYDGRTLDCPPAIHSKRRIRRFLYFHFLIYFCIFQIYEIFIETFGYKVIKIHQCCILYSAREKKKNEENASCSKRHNKSTRIPSFVISQRNWWSKLRIIICGEVKARWCEGVGIVSLSLLRSFRFSSCRGR